MSVGELRKWATNTIITYREREATLAASQSDAKMLSRVEETDIPEAVRTMQDHIPSCRSDEPVSIDGWDTHVDNFTKTKNLMGTLDPAMSALIAELERRGKLGSTIVLWMGDFGRTPKINANDGRDHHPGAWSAVISGGGITKGLVHGETDADAEKVVKDAVTAPNLIATVAAALGLDPAESFLTPIGRPLSITDHGTPIAALLRG
jgi:uncharacterized protein (DUF1501 family)